MASSVSSVALVPFGAFSSRALAVEAGVPTPFDADALRRDKTLQTETLDQARRDGVRAENRGGGEDGQADPRPAPGRAIPASNAPFLAQLLAQDQPAERKRPPFADAAQAYGRFREEPKAGFVLDPPRRVDVKV